MSNSFIIKGALLKEYLDGAIYIADLRYTVQWDTTLLYRKLINCRVEISILVLTLHQFS